MKTIHKILVALSSIVIFFLFTLTAYGVSILQGSGGGTGYATTTVGNIGKFLQVTTNNPITYSFASAGGGASTSSVQSILLPLVANGTVAGVNASSSTVSFNVQGTGTLNPFNVSSSTGTSLLTIFPTGRTLIGSSSQTSNLVDVGNLYTDPAGKALMTVAKNVAAVSADNSSIQQGLFGRMIIDSSSTKNWTAGVSGTGVPQLSALVGTFSSSASGTTVTSAGSLRLQFTPGNTNVVTGYNAIANWNAPTGGATVTNAVGIAQGPITAGTNNTYNLFGTFTPATGNYLFYDTSGYNSQLSGSINLLGTTNHFLSILRNTTSNTAGGTLTLSSGSATSGATDKGSNLVVQSGISTGGGISQIQFLTAGVNTSTGAVLQVTLPDPVANLVSGYTAGDVLTMADIGSGTATIVIDTVNGSGIPLTWHISAGGSAYPYAGLSSPTGGTGVNAFFEVSRISGTSDNATSTQATIDYSGLTVNNDIHASGIGYFTNGIYTANNISQRDISGSGLANTYTSRSVFGSALDEFPSLSPSAVVYQSAYGLLLKGANNTYPTFSNLSTTGAETFQTFANGDTESLGNQNTANGGNGTIQNYFLQSENPANASWVKTRVTATDNATTSPNGLVTGGRLDATATLTHSFAQTSSSLPAGTYTVSLYMKSATSTSISAKFTSTGFNSSIGINNISTDWARFRYSFTTTGTGTIKFELDPNSTESFYVFGIQLVAGSSADVYYHTKSSTLTTAIPSFFSNNNILSLGLVGVGTVTPSSVLQIDGTASTTIPLLTVSSSTGSTLFNIGITGELILGGGSPTMGTCGTSPSISGNDQAGKVTVGGGVVTSCAVLFGKAKSGTPHIFITVDGVTAIANSVSSVTSTGFTVNFAATLGGGTFDYFVISN